MVLNILHLNIKTSIVMDEFRYKFQHTCIPVISPFESVQTKHCNKELGISDNPTLKPVRKFHYASNSMTCFLLLNFGNIHFLLEPYKEPWP